MKKNHTILLFLAVMLGTVVVAGAAVVYSGGYNVAADAPHTRPVYALLETARKRSIAVRAADLQPPADLSDPARIRQGAGNYDAMCTGCHLSPGSGPTELSRGLYPAPPDLTRAAPSSAEAFWVIKHGIKASGMPAWGTSMGDEYIWNMAAFLQELPKLDRAQYQALVASSGGHSHGGGETGGHAHADGEGHHDDASGAKGGMAHGETGDGHASSHAAEGDAGTTHVHADGKAHTHAAPDAAGKKDTPPADDGHAHQH
ncbi:cytochrome c [Pseudomonas sp. R2.Fl]|nr:cytochrome c [Pseudomonas sp. R2.Fl]